MSLQSFMRDTYKCLRSGGVGMFRRVPGWATRVHNGEKSIAPPLAGARDGFHRMVAGGPSIYVAPPPVGRSCR